MEGLLAFGILSLMQVGFFYFSQKVWTWAVGSINTPIIHFSWDRHHLDVKSMLISFVIGVYHFSKISHDTRIKYILKKLSCIEKDSWTGVFSFIAIQQNQKVNLSLQWY